MTDTTRGPVALQEFLREPSPSVPRFEPAQTSASLRRSLIDLSRIVVLSMLKPGESAGIVAASWRLPERLLLLYRWSWDAGASTSSAKGFLHSLTIVGAGRFRIKDRKA